MFQIGMGEGEGQSCSSSMNRCSIVRQTTWVCYKNLLLVFCILNIQCQIYYAEVKIRSRTEYIAYRTGWANIPKYLPEKGRLCITTRKCQNSNKRNIFYSMNRGFLCWGFANVGEFSIILPIWYVYITQLTATAFLRFLIILVMFMCLLRLA